MSPHSTNDSAAGPAAIGNPAARYRYGAGETLTTASLQVCSTTPTCLTYCSLAKGKVFSRGAYQGTCSEPDSPVLDWNQNGAVPETPSGVPGCATKSLVPRVTTFMRDRTSHLTILKSRRL